MKKSAGGLVPSAEVGHRPGLVEEWGHCGDLPSLSDCCESVLLLEDVTCPSFRTIDKDEGDVKSIDLPGAAKSSSGEPWVWKPKLFASHRGITLGGTISTNHRCRHRVRP